VLLVVLAVAVVTFLAGSTAGAAGSTGLVSIGAGLRGPRGLRATRVASGVTHVSAIAFDGDGRMWIATADSTPKGADGVYVADAEGGTPRLVMRLATPMGLLWHEGALYVSYAGGVDVYRSFDGTGFASHQTVLAVPAGTGLVGSLTLGADGRFVVGISAPCDACTPASAWSAAVLSFLPDGSDVQVVASHIRAAVGLAVAADGTLYASVNQRDDLGKHTPGDWLVVVRPGQDWGFPACYGQGGEVCAGTPRPVGVLDAHAAATGVALLTGQLGPGFAGTALVAEWAKGAVVAVPLGDPSGRVAAHRVITGLRAPVPLAVGPAGALYVGDWETGAVYRIARG
jgi:glucose/arabinose dehydrogenase